MNTDGDNAQASRSGMGSDLDRVPLPVHSRAADGEKIILPKLQPYQKLVFHSTKPLKLSAWKAHRVPWTSAPSA